MYAIYKQKKYRANKLFKGHVTLYSYSQDEGFENYVSPRGEISYDFFSKVVDIHELDYLYETVYEIQYKGHFFDVMSAMKRINIDEDWFAIRAGIEKYELIEKLGFEVYDKGQWWKKLDEKISKLSKSLKNHWESSKTEAQKLKSSKEQTSMIS